MTIEKILQILIGEVSEEKAEAFLRFLSAKLWDLYNEDLMDKVKMADSAIKWDLDIPNAKEGQTYEQAIEMPRATLEKAGAFSVILEDVSGLDKDLTGLKVSIAQDKRSFCISGTPTLEKLRQNGAIAPSTFELTLQYRFDGTEMPEDCPLLEKKISFVINQDPRKLWKDLPVDWDSMPDPKYKKEDTQTDYIKVEALTDGTLQKDIVAASKRGRSHAQEAKPRDDHFKMDHMSNGWYIMAVADGAGSAKYSREGSRIACDTAVDHCKQCLMENNSKNFEDAIGDYNGRQGQEQDEARKKVGDCIYNIVGKAAFKAQKAIEAEAADRKIDVKSYATTLLLTICKRFPFGWFVASFWVGDGAICLYDRKSHTSKILGVPDEGEYAGQTRFLTMPEIFRDATSLYQRLRFYIVKDFTALFLMTDGVSDPKFETDANLDNTDKWDELWDDLKSNGVELVDDNEASKEQLLKWLDFWSPGNHDDRTIAILYEGEKVSDCAEKEETFATVEPMETSEVGTEMDKEETETEEKTAKG